MNGSPLKANDGNLPVFAYLAKLTRNISNSKNKDLPVETDYFNTKDFLYGTSIGYYAKEVKANPNLLISLFKPFCQPENAKLGVNVINNSIQETMVDYLG